VRFHAPIQLGKTVYSKHSFDHIKFVQGKESVCVNEKVVLLSAGTLRLLWVIMLNLNQSGQKMLRYYRLD
jgi:archaeosine-15-forming tRNA-guanine transglycosylase